MNEITPRILIAGIGNIFLGDDAFGAEVAQRLLKRPHPANVRVEDFGIRGLDLTYRLLEDFDVAILIDAAPRGKPVGTLTLIEPEAADLAAPMGADAAMLDTHNMDPLKVLRYVTTLGGTLRRVLVLACEPQPLEAEYDDMQMGLSEPVSAAVDEAVVMIESLVAELSGVACTSSPSH
ncbi:MAG: hydrogenase maturation protease [Tepidisphaeraceae bacterium]